MKRTGHLSSRFRHPGLSALAAFLFAVGLRASEPTDRPPESWRWSRFDEASGLTPCDPDELAFDRDGTLLVRNAGSIFAFDGYQFRRLIDPGRQEHVSHLVDHPSLGPIATTQRAVYQIQERQFTRLGPNWLAGEHAESLVNGGGDWVYVHLQSEQPRATNRIVRLDTAGITPLVLPQGVDPDQRMILHGAGGCLLLATLTGLHLYANDVWTLVLASKQVPEIQGNVTHHDSFLRWRISEPPELRAIWLWSPPGKLQRGTAPLGTEAVLCESEHDRIRPAMLAGHAALERRPFRLPPTRFGQARHARCRDGKLWISTSTGVFLYRFASRRWTFREPDRDLGAVTEIAAARDGRLWLGFEEGVARLESTGLIHTLPNPQEDSIRIVTALAEDSSGDLWVGSGSHLKGVRRWDGETWQRFGPTEGFPEEYVHRIRKDHLGRLWFLLIGTHETSSHRSGSGVVIWNGSRFESWSAVGELPSGHVYDFEEDPSGALWFATARGIARFDRGTWTTWGKDDGLPRGRAYALEGDSAGRMWFALQRQGYGWIENDRVHLPAPSIDVPADVWDLAFDERGRLWMSGKTGLHVVPPELPSQAVRVDDLGSMWTWPLLADDGRLWIGTRDHGLSILDLHELAHRPPRIAVQLLTTHEHGARLELDVWSFEGRLPRELIEVSYRTTGTEWSPWTRERLLSLEGLDAGLHRVELRARGLLGQATGESTFIEFEVAPPFLESTTFHVLLVVASGIGVLLFTGFLVRFARDQRRIRLSEHRYRELFEGARDAIFVLDQQSCIVSVNGRAQEHFGALSALRGRRFVDVLDTGNPAEVERVLEHARHGGDDVVHELTVGTQDGNTRVFEVSFSPVLDVEVHSELQCIARDVTPRKHLERERFEARRLQILGELTRRIAHDFRNFVTIVRSAANHAIAPGLPEAQRKDLDVIRETAESASELAGQLLNFGAELPGTQAILDCGQALREMEPILSRLHPRAVELRCTHEGPPVWILLDRLSFQQIVLNLVLNSCEAMPLGGTIELTTHAHGTYGCLTIRDDGHGMDPETRERIFEPLFTTKQGTTASGLGLTTVRALVSAAGGSIEVTSNPSRGTCFRLCFPRSEAEVPDSSHEEAGSRPGPSAGLDVLVIDDDETVLRLVGAMLRHAGHRPHEASNGEKALTLVADERVPIDLIVSDVDLPGFAGPELIRRIDDVRPGLPVIFVSGYLADVLPQQVRHGATAFLGKPFTLDELRRVVERVQGAIEAPS